MSTKCDVSRTLPRVQFHPWHPLACRFPSDPISIISGVFNYRSRRNTDSLLTLPKTVVIYLYLKILLGIFCMRLDTLAAFTMQCLEHKQTPISAVQRPSFVVQQQQHHPAAEDKVVNRGPHVNQPNMTLPVWHTSRLQQ